MISMINNKCLRKVTNGKECFVSEEALEKVLYLRVKELEKKWVRTTKSNWGIILNELIEIFGKRVEKYKKNIKCKKNEKIFIYLFIYGII